MNTEAERNEYRQQNKTPHINMVFTSMKTTKTPSIQKRKTQRKNIQED